MFIEVQFSAGGEIVIEIGSVVCVYKRPEKVGGDFGYYMSRGEGVTRIDESSYIMIKNLLLKG